MPSYSESDVRNAVDTLNYSEAELLTVPGPTDPSKSTDLRITSDEQDLYRLDENEDLERDSITLAVSNLNIQYESFVRMPGGNNAQAQAANAILSQVRALNRAIAAFQQRVTERWARAVALYRLVQMSERPRPISLDAFGRPDVWVPPSDDQVKPAPHGRPRDREQSPRQSSGGLPPTRPIQITPNDDRPDYQEVWIPFAAGGGAGGPGPIAVNWDIDGGLPTEPGSPQSKARAVIAAKDHGDEKAGAPGSTSTILTRFRGGARGPGMDSFASNITGGGNERYAHGKKGGGGTGLPSGSNNPPPHKSTTPGQAPQPPDKSPNDAKGIFEPASGGGGGGGGAPGATSTKETNKGIDKSAERASGASKDTTTTSTATATSTTATTTGTTTSGTGSGGSGSGGSGSGGQSGGGGNSPNPPAGGGSGGSKGPPQPAAPPKPVETTAAAPGESDQRKKEQEKEDERRKHGGGSNPNPEDDGSGGGGPRASGGQNENPNPEDGGSGVGGPRMSGASRERPGDDESSGIFYRRGPGGGLAGPRAYNAYPDPESSGGGGPRARYERPNPEDTNSPHGPGARNREGIAPWSASRNRMV